MRTFTAVVLLLVISFSKTVGQIATYTGSGGVSTTVVGVPNETVSILQATGFGSNTPCSSGGLSGITVNTSWSTYSTAGPRVFFKITPHAGYMLNITNITAGIRRSGTGPVNTRFAYSLDNGASWINDGVNLTASSGGCGSTLVSSWGGGTLPTGITSTVNGIIIALFPFAPGSSTGTYQVNSIVVNGSVTPACTAPALYTVTGGGSYCSGGSGVSIGLSGSQPGVSYQLYNGAATAGAAITGTGSAISFGSLTAAGTYTVLATSTPGCTSAMTGSAVITINPLPAAITGALSVCEGLTGTVASTTAGGTWSTASPVATVGAASGIVSGLTPGTGVVTYTLPTGCFNTATITINAAPSAIAGSPQLCQGATITLTNSVGGGTWSSSAAGIATIGATTGIVSGSMSGTSIISYTAPTCNPATLTITVNPLAAISGTLSVCQGLTTSLGNANPGGTWSSSNTGVAAISASGIASGVSAGTTIISYTLPTGCTATAILTVHPAVSAISGTLALCTSNASMLTSSSAGGSWTSSNPLIAPVSPTGTVTGSTAGTALISYTLPTACAAIAVVTVHPLPGAIAGATFICQGSTASLSSTTAGGSWSSTTPAVATISASGIVSGISSGTSVISYTLGTGCSTTATVTVNPLPAAITGSSIVCIGLSTPLSSTTSGGTWASSNTAVATADVATGAVTGISAGTATISYIFGTGCSSTHTISVNIPPTPITGPAEVCAGSTITLSNSIAGGLWSTSATAIAVVSPLGVVTGVSSGLAEISYTTTACNSVTRSITVHPLPATITGITNVCVGSVTTLGSTTPGGTWSSSNSLASVSATGTVTGLAPGSSAVITYTLPTGCFITAPVIIDSLPAPIAGSDSVCQGSSVTLSNTTVGGIWSSSNGTIASATAVSGIVSGVFPGTVSIAYTLITGCKRTIPFKVIEPLPASVTISHTAPGTLCDGTPVTFTATGINGGTPVYEWYKFGVLQDTGSTFTYTPIHGDYISVKMRVNGLCAAPSPAHDHVYMNVYPASAPFINISTHSDTVLDYPGQMITIFSDVTFGGAITGYQWFHNSSPIPGATNSSYSTALYGNDTFYCTVAGNAPCALSTTGVSNRIVIHSSLATLQLPAAPFAATLYPNPNTGSFTISGSAERLAPINVIVCDVLGKTVYSSQIITSGSGAFHSNIFLNEGHTEGLYLLRLESGSNSINFHFVIGRK